MQVFSVGGNTELAFFILSVQLITYEGIDTDRGAGLDERLVFQDFITSEREGEGGITCRPKARLSETAGHQSGRRVTQRSLSVAVKKS